MATAALGAVSRHTGLKKGARLAGRCGSPSGFSARPKPALSPTYRAHVNTRVATAVLSATTATRKIFFLLKE